jgi:DNA polymerase I
MMRLAACLATERGIEVCAPVHDAFLICAPFDRLDADIAATRAAMTEASRIVLGGFELRTEVVDDDDSEFVSVVRHPNRFMDERGLTMWNTVTGLLHRPDLARQVA